MEELEMMRIQLDALKQQLDTQQIINKDLLRKIMRRKASWLNRFVNFEIVALPLTYLLFVGISVFYGISQWYAFLFLVFGAIDTAFDWRAVRIPPSMFGTASILDLKRLLLRQKKMRFVQTCIGAPLAIIWIAAFFYEMLTHSFQTIPHEIMHNASSYISVGGLTGAFIGIITGVITIIIIYHKMQHTNDDLLRDIHDLENDK